MSIPSVDSTGSNVVKDAFSKVGLGVMITSISGFGVTLGDGIGATGVTFGFVGLSVGGA